MLKQKFLLSKITRPSVSRILIRNRLFKLLDRGRNKPVIWISAPAGSGKTTLISSYLDARKLSCLWYQMDEGDADIASFFYYMGIAAKKANPRRRAPMPLLTPEYLLGIPTFTRRFFEKLYSCLAHHSFTIVFDNHQNVPQNSGFHEMIMHGLEVIPEGINVIVLSRNEPPPQLARLRANANIGIIGWDEIRFTLKESREIIRMRGNRQGRLSDKAMRELYEKTKGWAAGLMLMLESARTKIANDQILSALPQQSIFDYFATEIFHKANADVQEFLLKTAFLPRMTYEMSEKLTGIVASKQILSALNRNNYFTERYSSDKPVYQYHPLFREFLLAQIKKTYEESEIKQIRKSAALLLAESGQIEDAAELFISSEDWGNLTEMILGWAQSIMMQGRISTLERWLFAIPEKIREDAPWLRYWLGICRMPFDAAESRRLLEHAFHLFQRQNDTAGTFLAWSGAVDTILFEWNNFKLLDCLIDQFDGYMQSRPAFLSPEIELRAASSMMVALMIRQPWRPDLQQWMEKALSLARQTPDVNLCIRTLSFAANYYGWIGNLDKAKNVLEEIRRFAHLPGISPLTKITWMWLETALSIIFGLSIDSAVNKIYEVIDFARTTGVHVWDHMLLAMGVYVSLLRNDLETAHIFLKKKEGILRRTMGSYSHYLYLSAWYYHLKGDFPQAAADAEKSLALAEESGYVFPIIQCRLEVAHLLHEQGRHKEADAHVAHAYALSNRAKSIQHGYACLLAKARFAFDGGREKDGLEFLGEALRIGRENGYFYLLWWPRPKVTARLCAHALEAGVETEHVRNLIRTCKLEPPPEKAAEHIENWPFPIRIYTIGRFEILKDDRPLAFSGKIQQKPLDLLKAMIAFGGENVPIENMMDALWPEADGDRAYSAFTTTLQRLRKLLGRDDAIIVQGRKASLNPRICRVDSPAKK